MNINLFAYLPWLIVAGIGFIVLLVVLRKTLVNVGAREIAIKERRYFGAKMPPGRVAATEGSFNCPSGWKTCNAAVISCQAAWTSSA